MAYKVGIVFVVLAGIVALAMINAVVVASFLWIVYAVAIGLSLYTIARTDTRAYSSRTWVPKKKAVARRRVSQDGTVVKLPSRA